MTAHTDDHPEQLWWHINIWERKRLKQCRAIYPTWELAKNHNRQVTTSIILESIVTISE